MSALLRAVGDGGADDFDPGIPVALAIHISELALTDNCNAKPVHRCNLVITGVGCSEWVYGFSGSSHAVAAAGCGSSSCR